MQRGNSDDSRSKATAPPALVRLWLQLHWRVKSGARPANDSGGRALFGWLPPLWLQGVYAPPPLPATSPPHTPQQPSTRKRKARSASSHTQPVQTARSPQPTRLVRPRWHALETRLPSWLDAWLRGRERRLVPGAVMCFPRDYCWPAKDIGAGLHAGKGRGIGGKGLQLAPWRLPLIMGIKVLTSGKEYKRSRCLTAASSSFPFFPIPLHTINILN